MAADFVFISTNSNQHLAEKVSAELATYVNAPLSKSQIIYFSNGEIKIKITESVRGKEVFILSTGIDRQREGGHSLNDHVMETLVACSACKTSDARSITVILPCFPYARQDKKHRSREPITARLICSLLETAGATRIMSIDLHSDQIQGMANIPFDNLFAEKYMIRIITKDLKESKDLKGSKNSGKKDFDPRKWIIVAPDAGALKRARHLASYLGLKVAILEKERDYTSPNQILRSTLIGSVRNRNVLITDDMIDTGGTLISGVDTLVKNGALNIYVAITHGLLSGKAIERLNECDAIKKIYVSDTISQEYTMERCDKIRVYSVSELLARAIVAIHHGRSISRLFE